MSGGILHTVFVRTCLCSFLLAHSLTWRLASGQVSNCDPRLVNSGEAVFQGSAEQVSILMGFDHLIEGHMDGNNLTGTRDLCVQYLTDGINTTLLDHGQQVLSLAQETFWRQVVESLPTFPVQMAACRVYVSEINQMYHEWMNNTHHTFNTTTATGHERLEGLVNMMDFLGGRIAQLEHSEDCGTDLANASSGDTVVVAFSQAFSHAHEILKQLHSTTRFILVANDLETVALTLQEFWSFLPSKASGWNFVDNILPVDARHLTDVLSSATCASLSHHMKTFCAAGSHGNYPELHEICLVQPSVTVVNTLRNVERYLRLLTAPRTAVEEYTRLLLRFLLNDTLTVDTSLCQPTAGHHGNFGGSSELASTGIMQPAYLNTTRCLNLDCSYPYTLVHDRKLIDPYLTLDLANFLTGIFQASPTINSIHRCGRSCKRLFSYESSSLVQGALWSNYLVTALCLPVYTYAVVIVWFNRRKILDVLHWRALIYINACLIFKFILSRLNMFSKGSLSMCFDNEVNMFQVKYTDATWQCRASATSSEIIDIVFPIFTAWQAFIWFSYIRRVSGLRASATARSKRRWNLMMKVGEVLALLIALAVVVVPFALGSYDNLLVNGQPLGLPCFLEEGSPYQDAPIIGLSLHCLGLILLGCALYFFIKSSVVKRKVWKIPVIGSSWMRTQSSLRHQDCKTLDVDYVMRQTQNRIAFFMFFVMLYQVGLFIVFRIEGSLLSEADVNQLSEEFNTKTHCHVFSCSPEECSTTYTFTEHFQQVFLPRYVYTLVFNVLGLCLLSFLTFPGFDLPHKRIPERYRLKKVLHVKKKRSSSTAGVLNHKMETEANKSLSSESVTGRNAQLKATGTRLSLMSDSPNVLEVTSPTIKHKPVQVSYSTQSAPPESVMPSLNGGTRTEGDTSTTQPTSPSQKPVQRSESTSPYQSFAIKLLAKGRRFSMKSAEKRRQRNNHTYASPRSLGIGGSQDKGARRDPQAGPKSLPTMDSYMMKPAGESQANGNLTPHRRSPMDDESKIMMFMAPDDVDVIPGSPSTIVQAEDEITV